MPSSAPVGLRCEFHENPIGIDETAPRLSWQSGDTRPAASQTAYRITAATSPKKLDEAPDLWDSGRIKSASSLDVIYAGKKLTSRRRVWWRVRTWDRSGAESAWSSHAFFEMGLLKSSDWAAKWIGRPLESKEGCQPCPYLRREFQLREHVKSARIYVSARGLFELHLNGQRVGSDYFTPGWTDYDKRIQYLVYDVTSLLTPGANAIGATLGDGWYAGYLVWSHRHFLYGDQISLLLQMEVEYEDGTRDLIATNPEWKTSLGPIVASDIYHGENYDATREMFGWNVVNYPDSSWAPAVVFDPPKAKLVAKHNPPVRKQEELSVQTQSEPSFGVHIFDLGQNMVGWARVKVRAPAGTKIRMRFAEMLNPDGTLYTANLRAARATDTYICRGDGEETFEPHFTFHGFRYVELTGLCEKPAPSDVTGIVLHSDMMETGSFECSNAMVNRIQTNIRWSQKGNFLEVPTDCPQRDERLGWTGDAQVFAPTACFNRDVAAFFEKWAFDVADGQQKDGGCVHVAPDVLHDGGVATAWGDASVICPWTVYLQYGDTRILDRNYETMARWIGWHKANSRNFVSTAGSFGDWLAIDIARNNPGAAPTPVDLISTAYFAKVSDTMSKIATILGKKADAKKYAAISMNVKAAFNREFVTGAGRVVGDTQTGYLLALGFELLPKDKQAYALQRLVADIQKRGWKLSTGFVGTPLLAPVLTRFGRTDVAYKLLLQEEYPSWIYSIHQGATTMWERWNSYTKESGFGDVNMNSFNHYAYGAIGEWMHNTVAGIGLDPEEPGYRHIIVRPQPGGGLTFVKATLMSRYGLISSSWKCDDATMTLDLAIPANTTATVFLPGQKPREVAAGAHRFTARMPKAKTVR